MVRLLAAFTVLFALLVAGSALASDNEVIAGSPSVKAVHAHGGTVITFKGSRGRQLFRGVAGREIILSCQPAQLDPTSSLVSEDQDDFVAPKRGGKLRAILEGDWCELLLARKHHKDKSVVAVAITPVGAVFLDERLRAVLVDGFVTAASIDAKSGHYPTTQEFVADLHAPVIALTNPADPVPPGKYGFYSDGAQHVEAVGVTSAGKRLFEDVNGDVVSTNVFGYLGSLSFD